MSNKVMNTPRPKLWRSCRLSISVCIFLASFKTSFLRDSAGMALICMAKPQNNVTCNSNDAVVPTLPWLINKKNCEFNWDAATRGRLLASSQYGYMATTMVGGFISNHFGAKTPIMLSGFGSSISHLLCPFAVLLHTEVFFAIRVLQGMFSGLMVGPFFELFGAWLPEDEISTLLSFSFSGFAIGTILAYPLSGQLCDVNVSGVGGWPLIFYVPAVVWIFIVSFWFVYLYDSPQLHPNISDKEYQYLLENIGIYNEPASIPWLSIFTSLPIIAYIICYAVFMWNLCTILNNIPIFMQNVIGVSPSEDGYLLSLPFCLSFIIRIMIGKLYQVIKNSTGLSHTVCRKIFYAIGSLMVILSCFTIIYIQNITKWHAISSISSILACGEIAYSGGFYPTLLSMTPNYAGLLSGISTFFAYLIGTQSILINSIITKQNTREEWNMVFWILVFAFAFSMCFYLIFGSASLQKWSTVPQEEVRRSRSTLLMNKSFGASRNVSLRHPSHVF